MLGQLNIKKTLKKAHIHVICDTSCGLFNDCQYLWLRTNYWRTGKNFQRIRRGWFEVAYYTDVSGQATEYCELQLG